MQGISNQDTNHSWCITHALTPEDKKAMAGMRAMVEPNKGRMQGITARGPYDGILSRVVAPPGVTYEADTVGGIAGWWCRPDKFRTGEAILHLHGGWFNWGSAQAFRHLVGYIAAHAGAAAFIPDYRLALEHPFPAAVDDVQACYRGMLERGVRKIAVTGDSAGGCLALLLLSSIVKQAPHNAVIPVGAVALSPVTDLALTGASWQTRAADDPFFTKSQVVELVRSYLSNHEPTDPLASPLYDDPKDLPPIRVHVGEDEVLLDDSLRWVERAVAAGIDAKVDVWEGMAHGFLSSVGNMAASNAALDAIGIFLTERLTAGNL
jgi:monoterpene epsilon-lactone hydrolase